MNRRFRTNPITQVTAIVICNQFLIDMAHREGGDILSSQVNFRIIRNFVYIRTITKTIMITRNMEPVIVRLCPMLCGLV